MGNILFGLMGLFLIHEAQHFRKSGLPILALAYSVLVALLLLAEIFDWLTLVKAMLTFGAIGLYALGTYLIRKHERDSVNDDRLI